MQVLARYRGFRYLWIGQLLSQMGNAVFLVMALWELQLRSPYLLSAAGLAMTVPAAAAVVGGALVDRHDPFRLMWQTDLLRGVAVACGLAALVVPGSLPWALIGLLAVNSLGAAVFAPAEQVVVPRLVLDADLPAANGVYQLTAQAAGALGSALGGAAVVAVGVRLVFGIDLGSFWASALAIVLTMRAVARPRPSPADGAKQPSIGGALREGWRGLARLPWLLRLLPLVLLNNFAFQAAFTMLPYWSRHLLHTRAVGFGLIDAAWAAGLMVGSVSVGFLGRWPLRRLLTVMAAVTGLATLGFAAVRTPGPAGFLLMVSGAANGVLNALLFTLMQRLIPEAVRGRTFGLLMTLLTVVTPLGSLAAGVTLGRVPLAWSWVLGGLGGLAIAALAPRLFSAEDDLAEVVDEADGGVG
jgi:DHA3 family macrolide efflux protein-like MFS transporter